MLAKYHGASPCDIFGEQYVYDHKTFLPVGTRGKGLTIPQLTGLKRGMISEIKTMEEEEKKMKTEMETGGKASMENNTAEIGQLIQMPGMEIIDKRRRR